MTVDAVTRLHEAAAEASRFFMGDADVQRALAKLCRTLREDKIPYAIAGAMALNAYGYRRVTVDVDVILTRDGLARFKERHLGRGYVERVPGGRGMRDTEHNVGIVVLIASEFPGDGKQKPIAFPDPASLSHNDVDDVVVPVKVLVELKLASGISAPHRLKDLADVLELIKAAALPLELADQLDASVREKYRELWNAAQIRDDDEGR